MATPELDRPDPKPKHWWRRSGPLTRMLFPPRLVQWLGPLTLSAAAVLLIAVLVITSGMLNLAASTPHPAGWAELLHFTFKRSTAFHSAGEKIPANFGAPDQVAKGATYYGMACSHCHGGPGLGQNPTALSMTPRPQYLIAEIGDFTDRELFRIVKNGVKYSGMPAFPAQDRDDEVWSLVSFLRRMPGLTPAQYWRLAYGDALSAGGTPAVAPLADTFRTHPFRLALAGGPPVDTYRYSRPTIGFDAFSIDGDVVKTCARCHTNEGAARAGGAIPNIALLDSGYFITALRKYGSGKRHSAFMQQVATQLSDEQIVALARYYAGQPKRRTEIAPVDPATLALGQRIASAGIPARGIGACADCHDITRASAKAFPAIDGQHAAYLAGRLRQFRAQPAPIPGGNPMIAISHTLDDREIDAATRYYAARGPGAPRPVMTAPR